MASQAANPANDGSDRLKRQNSKGEFSKQYGAGLQRFQMRTLAITSAIVGLALMGCADPNLASRRDPGLSPTGEKGIWLRTDGQSGRNDPAIAGEFAADKAACATVIEVDRACMAQRGYLLVPESQVEAKAEELRAAVQSR